MARDRPREPGANFGSMAALALAIAVHVAFIAVLIFSLRWQNRQPEPVTAELYAPPSKTAVAEPARRNRRPRRRPPRSPLPSPSRAPPPPKTAPKPAPSVEKPDTRAADIARKARPKRS